MKGQTYNKVWVVFDKDDNQDFDEAIALAKKGSKALLDEVL